MNEEELYKLLNIPNKPWIELTDEEKHLFEKNDTYIKKLQQKNIQLQQQLKEKDEKISEIIEYIKENIKAELLNGSIWIDKCKLLNILESNKED